MRAEIRRVLWPVSSVCNQNVNLYILAQHHRKKVQIEDLKRKDSGALDIVKS